MFHKRSADADSPSFQVLKTRPIAIHSARQGAVPESPPPDHGKACPQGHFSQSPATGKALLDISLSIVRARSTTPASYPYAIPAAPSPRSSHVQDPAARAEARYETGSCTTERLPSQSSPRPKIRNHQSQPRQASSVNPINLAGIVTPRRALPFQTKPHGITTPSPNPENRLRKKGD
jgi:hypothetical protein